MKLSTTENSSGKMLSSAMIATAGLTISQLSRRVRAASVRPRGRAAVATVVGVDAVTGPASWAAVARASDGRRIYIESKVQRSYESPSLDLGSGTSLTGPGRRP